MTYQVAVGIDEDGVVIWGRPSLGDWLMFLAWSPVILPVLAICLIRERLEWW